MISQKITLQEIEAKQPGIKSFVFDLDGTLLDTKEGVIIAIKTYLDEIGLVVSKEEIIKRFGTPIEKLLKIFFPELESNTVMDHVNNIRELYHKIHLDHSTIYPKTKYVLSTLKDAGFKIAVASTKFKPFVVEGLEHFDLIKFCDAVVSGYEVDRHKPAPDILFETAKRLNVPTKASVFTGDSVTDIQAGKAAGSITIGVLTGSYSVSDFEKLEPDFIIDNLDAFSF